MNTIINTLLAYLQSKTVQGILGLVFLGILKTQHIQLFSEDIMSGMAILFSGWLGIGLRNVIKPISPKSEIIGGGGGDKKP